jgi:predicted DNA-binding mobile mystery protein A
MKPEHKTIIREQLEATLSRLSKAAKTRRPSRGWLRAVREALGMSSKQFANHLGVKPPRITALEKDEMSGAVTIKKMQEAASALECDFFYALIPRENLTSTIRKRAESLAITRLQRISHSMLLESQQLSDSEQKKVINSEVEEILRKMPKELWEDHGRI